MLRVDGDETLNCNSSQSFNTSFQPTRTSTQKETEIPERRELLLVPDGDKDSNAMPMEDDVMSEPVTKIAEAVDLTDLNDSF